MNLDFSEEQLMLRDAARDYLVKNYPKKTVRQLEEGDIGYSPESWKEMAEMGWMGLVLPEKYGGSGMSFQDLAVLLEEMGRACLPGPFFSTVVLGALPILDLGTEAQKAKYLPDIAKGDLIFTLALTEVSARYDAEGVKLKAESGKDGFTLNGTKLFIPDANVADYLICVARTANGKNPEEGISLFIVDARSPGIKFELLKTIANDKLCEVVFDNVKVARENVLGEIGKGWPVMEKIIRRAAAAKCCDMAGSLQQVFEMTLAYAKERMVHGQPIGSYQAVQHHCANMAIDVNGTMLSAYQAAWKVSADLPCDWEVAVAKAWASAACPRVIALAHQIHGAIGTTMDHDLHYYTRRTKAAESAFGDVDYYQWKVAREIGG
jgi:alkylation response protein AidB-like acyl-CoA dehydrogenase